jgi:hypothetical protein
MCMTDNIAHFIGTSAPSRITNLIEHHDSNRSNGGSEFTHSGTLMRYYAPQVVTRSWVDLHYFTSASVTDMATPRKKSEHKAYLSAVSGLVRWATGYGSLALDRAEIFHPGTISDYMQTMRPDAGDDSYRRRRRLLLQMSETLVHAEPIQVPPPGYGLGSTAPFSPAAFDGLGHWADRQSTPGRRRDADATLALCGGAGLTAPELYHARAQDLVFHDDGVFIFVPGDNPRLVPVNARWEDRVTLRFANTHPLAYLLRPGVSRRRKHQTWVSPGTRSAAEDAAELSARLRETWLRRSEELLNPAAAAYFAGHPTVGRPTVARELAKSIDFNAAASILRGAEASW